MVVGVVIVVVVVFIAVVVVDLVVVVVFVVAFVVIDIDKSLSPKIIKDFSSSMLDMIRVSHVSSHSTQLCFLQFSDDFSRF